MAGVTPEEQADILKLAEGMPNSAIVETLQDLIEREKGLLDPLGQDPEMREITLHNIACLAAAASRLST